MFTKNLYHGFPDLGSIIAIALVCLLLEIQSWSKLCVWYIICSFGLKQLTPETAFGNDLARQEKICDMNKFETL